MALERRMLGCARLWRALCVQRSGEPEGRQDAVVEEAGDGGDLVAFEGQHDQSVGSCDRALRVFLVEAEGGLGVRAGGDELEASVVGEYAGGEESRDLVVALVFDR